MTVRSYSPTSQVDISLRDVDPEYLEIKVSVGWMTVRSYSPMS